MYGGVWGMINIIVNAEEKLIEIEGEENVTIASLSHPATIIDLIHKILDKAHYTGETLCLELKDEAGFYHEVNRWGSIR